MREPERIENGIADTIAAEQRSGQRRRDGRRAARAGRVRATSTDYTTPICRARAARRTLLALDNQ